jgi:myo-inositol 2-dehydrogenase/D-chiro-inositol 1-dehydrogenase
MGRTHLAALRSSEVVTVTAVADASRAALDAAAAQALAGVDSYLDVDELLEDGKLDGVLVAAPSDVHLDVVRRAVGQGIAVLCEKPCGLTVEETEECARIAAKAGVLLRVAYWRRFVSDLAALRRRVLSGELGEILAVNCYQWDGAPPPASFRERSGGILVDMGVHELDQLRWLTGQEVEVLDAVASRLGAGPEDPDCAQLVARLSDGATSVVSLGRWHAQGDVCWVEVFGTSGTELCSFLRPDDGAEALAAALRAQAESFAVAARLAAQGDSAAGTGDALANDQGATAADAVAAVRLARIATKRLLSTAVAEPGAPDVMQLGS